MLLSPLNRELIARAFSIRERASALSEFPRRDDARDPDVEARLEAWARQVSPQGSEAQFEQRLTWLGLDRAAARRLAAPPVLAESFEPPAWFEIARQVRELHQIEPAPESADVAFGEYWRAWGKVGRARLEAGLGGTASELPEPILAGLERGLIVELASFGAICLLSAFDEKRLSWQLGPEHLIARLSRTPPKTLYQSFARELCSTPLVWTRFPALIRLAATRVSCWVDAVSEFARRLHADRAALGAEIGRELGPIVSLNDRVSDSHAGGRRVFLVRFADGIELVYKPRSMRSERAFNSIVRWANERLSDGPRLESHWVLDRDGYGWSELVTPLPCPAAEAGNYYERAGILLALAHVLVGSDCHEENVIAHGACPVLVDLETFLAPELLPQGDESLEYLAAIQRLEADSVLAVGMLPGWTWSRPGVQEISGFAGEGKSGRSRFADLNTDSMRLVRENDRVDKPSANQPRLASGAPIQADLHVDAIVRGFERVYRLALENVDELLRPDGPLADLRRGRARVVFRDTSEYVRVLGASLRPRSMEDGFARSVSLEVLAPLPLALAAEARWAPALLVEEQAALGRGDIPLFLADRATGALFSPDHEIGTLHAPGAGIGRLESRLRRLGPADLELQRHCIEAAFIARAIRAETAAVAPAHDAAQGEVGPELEDVALAMARAVRDCSLVGPRGGRFWLGLEAEASERAASRVGVLGPWLYSGQAGIALALSAAFARSRDASLSDAALAALSPLRQLLIADPDLAPLGAFDGLPGVIYALWHSARLLEEPSLASDARTLLGRLDRTALERDRVFDLTSGLAGSILALRCLAPVERERVSDLVRTAASHLVQNAKRLEQGVGWPNWLEKEPLCGMAHGNSGIAWALMEAFRITGDRAFREVSLAACAYERARRAATADGAWPDLREQPSNVVGWCHGPTGIALARSAMLEIEEVPELRVDFEIASALMQERSTSEPRVHLCCGQAGIDDVLLELGRRLGDVRSVERARARASRRMSYLGNDPDQWMQPNRGEGGIATLPGLMKGWSGIVLSLLRLSEPGDGTPCVLMLEP